MPFLNNEQLHEIASALQTAKLDARDNRAALTLGINQGFLASIPDDLNNRTAQILSDLGQFNDVPELDNGEVPLRQYLANSLFLARGAKRPEAAVFEKYVRLVDENRMEPPEPPRQGLERIVNENDLLNFNWLRSALECGRAIARLTVPRIENGDLVQPRGSLGTGWLLSPRHMMTNHHVINARSESEPVSSDDDLAAQAAATVVEFDVDATGETGIAVPVKKLAVAYAWNCSPELDFAILELAEAVSDRKPFVLAASQVKHLRGDPVPVNIIQHAGGQAKSIAIRNNLTTQTLGEYEVRYFTDTLQGSSGAPVCDDEWRVVALHRAEYRLTKQVEFQGKKTAWANRGVRIDRIVEFLREKHPGLLEDMDAAVI